MRSRSEILRVGLFVTGVLVMAGVFVFTTALVRRLSHQVAATSELLARVCAQASFPAARDPELQRILSEVIAGIDFPIVITDLDSIPRAWRLVDLDPALVPDASLDSLAQGLQVAPVIAARIERVRQRTRELDHRHAPIVMTKWLTQNRMGYLHYGDPPTIEQLRWLPYLTLAGLGLLIALALWGLAGIQRAERRSIWVGMALETAHQLGTPLSSLMGWVELLRSRAAPGGGAGDVVIPRAELAETLDEMERDVERLTKVAQRFSHVGSAPRLERHDVCQVVRKAVAYMSRRLPRRAGEVEIQERYSEVPPVPCDPELLEWAVENLLANSLSAFDTNPGRIEVTVGPRGDGSGVEIEVRDDGRGMSPREQRRAFDPGYSTKPRGWGMGLPLVRRVVHDFHGGRIAIRRSAPGEGTTIVITLPA